MRTDIRNCSIDRKPGIIAKMMFLASSGEPTSWIQMETVSLISSDRISYKRIGYLAASLFLHEESELLVLITQTLMSDLRGPVYFIQNYALTFIANVGSEEMCRTCAPEIQKLFEPGDPRILKALGMAALKCLRKGIQISFYKGIVKLLARKEHALVSVGIILVIEMIQSNPKSVDLSWKQVIDVFKVLSTSKSTHEYRMSFFNDPFLQCRVLMLLSVMNQNSMDIDDFLTNLITTVDVDRNTGRALLIQAIAAIINIAKDSSVSVMALNQLGKILAVKDKNAVYSGLAALARLLYNDREIIGRSSRSSIAIQKYKDLVIQRLEDRDPSIRRRALDVSLALVDGKNVDTIIGDVMKHLRLVDQDFRSEMVSKIYTTIQLFGRSPLWNFDTIHLLLVDSGDYVCNDVISSFCHLIATHKVVREHAVPILADSLASYSTNQALVQVCAWIIGEVGGSQNGNALDTMIRITSLPQTTCETKCCLVTAIAQLSFRFRTIDCVVPLFKQLRQERDVEVQQRAGEMLYLLESPDLAESLLACGEYIDEEEEEPVKLTVQTSSDLLTLPDDEECVLGHDLSLLVVSRSTPIRDLNVPPNAKEALRSEDFVVYFELQLNAANCKQLAIRVTIFSTTDQGLHAFNLQYGLPPGWVVVVQPITGTTLLPKKTKRPLQQVLMLENRGFSLLVMRVQISYLYGAQPLTYQSTVNPIFEEVNSLLQKSVSVNLGDGNDL
jgi:hypothetical protein